MDFGPSFHLDLQVGRMPIGIPISFSEDYFCL
jgi:hypothetical protein